MSLSFDRLPFAVQFSLPVSLRAHVNTAHVWVTCCRITVLVNDPYNLQRFVEAQNPIYDHVRSELKRGCKTGHWMWFIFPQIEGLGHSSMARAFAIFSLDEARAYLQHAVLGPRLIECTKLITQASGRTIEQILGYPDDVKFRSSMTLFAQAAADNQVFLEALQKYFSGEPDRMTLERI